MDKQNALNLIDTAVANYFGWLNAPQAAAFTGGNRMKGKAVAAFGMVPGSNKVAIRVWKKEGLHIPAVEALLKELHGDADVQVTGQIRVPFRPRATASSHKERMRPMVAGHSIGHHAITAGTLGAFVKTNGLFGGKLMILSNNHVLANSNEAKKGDAILQPGRYDGGTEDDVVAKLHDFEFIKPEGNVMDAAVALITAAHPVSTEMPDIGKVTNSYVEPKKSIQVQKAGRTTGYTKGKVTAINLRGVAVSYGPGMVCRFDKQIEVIADQGLFSDGGDSGSLVVDMDNNPVGLLFAGGGNRTIISPIAPIMKRFNIKFI